MLLIKMRALSVTSLYALQILALSADLTCKNPWKDFNKTCIYISSEHTNWTEANKYCKLNNSSLINISDMDKLKQLYDELISYKNITNRVYWTGHYVRNRQSNCENLKAKNEADFNNIKEAGFIIVYLDTNGKYIVCSSEHNSKKRYYICQFDKVENKQPEQPSLTTEHSTNDKYTFNIKTDISTNVSNVNDIDQSIIITVSICAVIAIVALAIGALCFFKVRGLQKQSTKKSALPKPQDKTDIVEEIGAYASIKETETKISSHSHSIFSNQPVNNVVNTIISANSNMEPNKSDQQLVLQNDGRYVTDEGLIYVTVSHVKPSPMANAVEKSEVKHDVVEYATVSKQSRLD